MVSTDKTWVVEPPDLLALAAASGDDHLEAFLAVIEKVPAGQQFTSNDLRSALDALGIPNTKRGGFFEAARKAGVIERVVLSGWGLQQPRYEASTGRSAHHARVARWRRPRAQSVESASGGAA